MKTVSYAIYGIINILIYSSGPEIIGIAQSSVGADIAGSPGQIALYVRSTRIILATIIPTGYCIAAVGFVYTARADLLGKDLRQLQFALNAQINQLAAAEEKGTNQREPKTAVAGNIYLHNVTQLRKGGIAAGGGLLIVVVLGLLVTSFVLRE